MIFFNYSIDEILFYMAVLKMSYEFNQKSKNLSLSV